MMVRVSIAAAMCFAAFAAQAAPADDVVAGLKQCAGLGDSAARLACYDSLASRASALPVAQAPQAAAPIAQTPPAQASAAPPHAPTLEEQKSWFGLDVAGLFCSSPPQQTTPQQFGSENTAAVHAQEEAAQTELESISAGVSDYAYTPLGKFIVFLDNGQVWRQIPGDADRAMFRKTAKDNAVTISRGFVGSYNMTINGSAKVFKVTRVK